MLAEVAAAAGGPCAIFDTTGALISCWPASSRWTAEDLRHDRGTPRSSFALPTGGTDHFQLVVRGGATGEPLATLIGPASSILAMQLNSAFKASAPHQAKLERLMQQLEDWQGVALKELTRTFRATGLDPHAPTFLVVAEPDRAQLPHAWRIRLAVQEHLNNAHVFTYRGLDLRPGPGPDRHRGGLGRDSGPAAGLTPADSSRASPGHQGAAGQRG